jgi:hypothetical protein
LQQITRTTLRKFDSNKMNNFSPKPYQPEPKADWTTNYETTIEGIKRLPAPTTLPPLWKQRVEKEYPAMKNWLKTLPDKDPPGETWRTRITLGVADLGEWLTICRSSEELQDMSITQRFVLQPKSSFVTNGLWNDKKSNHIKEKRGLDSWTMPHRYWREQAKKNHPHMASWFDSLPATDPPGETWRSTINTRKTISTKEWTDICNKSEELKAMSPTQTFYLQPVTPWKELIRTEQSLGNPEPAQAGPSGSSNCQIMHMSSPPSPFGTGVFTFGLGKQSALSSATPALFRATPALVREEEKSPTTDWISNNTAFLSSLCANAKPAPIQFPRMRPESPLHGESANAMLKFHEEHTYWDKGVLVIAANHQIRIALPRLADVGDVYHFSLEPKDKLLPIPN